MVFGLHFFFFSQPRVNQSRDFQTNTALSSVGNCEFCEKNTAHTHRNYMLSFAASGGVFY